MVKKDISRSPSRSSCPRYTHQALTFTFHDVAVKKGGDVDHYLVVQLENSGASDLNVDLTMKASKPGAWINYEAGDYKVRPPDRTVSTVPPKPDKANDARLACPGHRRQGKLFQDWVQVLVNRQRCVQEQGLERVALV